MKRTIGIVSLTFIGVTTMIGSGWLFGAFHSAQVAGPASLLAWVIGAFGVLLIALTIAELGALFAQTGGIARYLEYTHGSLSGFLAAWVNWIGIAACLPIEAAASVQYLSSIKGFHHLFNTAQGVMSSWGLLASSLLLLVYFLLNYWTLNLFLKSVTLITIFKLVVPILSVLTILWSGFYPENFGHNMDTFAPYGFHAVFIAVSAGGIIFTFNGFQSIVNFAGESKNPGRNVPIAIVSSILLCLLLYLFLQAGFIGALTPQNLFHGWHGINFNSPFVQLAISLNLNLIAILLYVDSVISPLGTGTTYVGACARMLFGMQRSGYMPEKFGVLHPVHNIPRNAMVASILVGFIFLWVFKGWGNLVVIISITHSLSYLAGPIAVMGLRRTMPTWHSPCRIKLMPLIAPLAFTIASLIIYWSRWPMTGQVLFLILGGLLLYLYYQKGKSWQQLKKHLTSGVWLACYLVVIALLSWLGDKDFGGLNIIRSPYDQITIVAVSLIFYAWGVKSAWKTPLLERFYNNTDML